MSNTSNYVAKHFSYNKIIDKYFKSHLQVKNTIYFTRNKVSESYSESIYKLLQIIIPLQMNELLTAR